MSDIFLRSVELSNFRVYGENYAFEFPEGPGITLITGANGLGKTSFFDAVEWALTGQIGRFSDLPSDARRKGRNPLTRVGAPENSHRVSLAFSEGSPIDRGAGYSPLDSSVERLLKQPNWPEIGSLHGYLSITHFLGQASTRRFSLRDPKSQWEALKGPAGIDRINVLHDRVSGQGIRQAFTRAIRERGQRLQAASSMLEMWQSLIEERGRLARLSSSERALSPKFILETVERFAQQFLPYVPLAKWRTVTDSDEAERALEQLATLLANSRSAIEVAENGAAELERLCVSYASAGDQINHKSKLSQEITDRRSSLVSELARAEATLFGAVSAFAGSEQRAAQIQSRAASLARVSRAKEQLDRGITDIAEAERQLEMSRIGTERAQAQLATCQHNINAAASLRADRNRITSEINAARLRAQLSVSLRAARSELHRLRLLLDGVQESALRDEYVELSSEARSIDDQIARIAIELRSHDERIQALAEAASRIAHELSHGDTHCPVCATSFEPGRLKALALANSVRDDSSAVELGSALATAKVHQENVKRKLAEINRKLIEHGQLSASFVTEQSREARLVQQLVDAGGVADADYDDGAVNSLLTSLSLIDEKISMGPSQNELDSELADAKAALEAERVKRASLERTVANVSSDIESARSLLAQHPEIWSVNDGLVVSIAQEEQAAQSEAIAVGEQLKDDQKQLDEARIARDAVLSALSREDASLATTNDELDKLTDSRRGLVRRWIELGQTGDPDRARVSKIRSEITERRVRAEPIESALSGLVNGLRIWQNDQQLQERERAITATIREKHVTQEDEVTALLQADVVLAQAQLDIAQRARVRMEDVGANMQARAKTFSDNVLIPLNDTIQRFSRTLMTWSDSSITYRAEHHATRSELRPAIIRTDFDGTTSQIDINPNYFFSEGQLSALSVSALLAASTTFSWSRWRGLLLDDPLQHNDIIHASAFMDLLRQMVRELGYQVILSSHDSSEAEFLAKKCRSAGIAFRVHELMPRGDAGLVSAVA